jgi:hypothetical protein
MINVKSKHCRRWRCRHVVGCLCNCKACSKLRPEDERAASLRSRTQSHTSEELHFAEVYKKGKTAEEKVLLTTPRDPKLKKIEVPAEMPSSRICPWAIVARATTVNADWFLYAVARTRDAAYPIMGSFYREFPSGTWALVDRESCVIVQMWGVDPSIERHCREQGCNGPGCSCACGVCSS